jgi:tRNA-binding protein
MGNGTFAPPALLPEIAIEDFLKLDIRLGTIIKAQMFEEARKAAFQLWIDFGEPLGVKKSSAQITRHYDLAELLGRRVAAVVNFPPRQIGKFMSEVLCLGFPDRDGEVVLVSVDRAAPNGGRLF